MISVEEKGVNLDNFLREEFIQIILNLQVKSLYTFR